MSGQEGDGMIEKVKSKIAIDILDQVSGYHCGRRMNRSPSIMAYSHDAVAAFGRRQWMKEARSTKVLAWRGSHHC